MYVQEWVCAGRDVYVRRFENEEEKQTLGTEPEMSFRAFLTSTSHVVDMWDVVVGFSLSL